MDSTLIEYLRLGKAWVLVGSGPSIEMGYPDSKRLANFAIQLVEVEGQYSLLPELKEAHAKKDFAKVFEQAQRAIGIKKLISSLDEKLKPTETAKIYEMLARWPIEVYLTTNYDDEIQTSLAKLGVAYRVYSNSEDSLSYLHPTVSGAIFKLHGDLKSEQGLVLTSSQYDEISSSESWEYWRTKLTSVFQMKPVVIIGHSLTDPHIQHILRAAKKGAGVIQPICWIAPDVSFQDQQKYLEEFRIRVVTYSNKNGNHKNLFQLVNTVTEFMQSRTAVHIQTRIAEISSSPLGTHAAAPGFYVFNKLNSESDFNQKRIEIATAALQAVIPELIKLGEFEIEEGLRIAGWPKGTSLTKQFSQIVGEQTVLQGLFNTKGDKYTVSEKANFIISQNNRDFQHLRARFYDSLVLRIKRKFPEIDHEDAKGIASDIEASLAGYFREGGLTLATLLFTNSKVPRENAVPSSIIKFITEASARYDDALKRQAFCAISLDSFVKAESAEREYLGRISQGFFAFHAFGAFGDVAMERLHQAKNTVWLVDSSAQIPSIALAAQTHALFRDCFLTLHSLGIRLFTTERLFDETWSHVQFARKVVEEHGCDSYHIGAAARGDLPYQKSNQFMEGFIRWQAAGNSCDWDGYLFKIFQTLNPRKSDLRNALSKIGIEVVSYEDWPGFHDFDFSDRENYIQKIIQRLQKADIIEVDYKIDDAYKKALPEAEAYVIIANELDGKYYIISQKSEKSPAWFISNTSMLNLLEPGKRITWQPEAFVRFTTTLYHMDEPTSASRAFETILWGIAQLGVSVLDEETIAKVFSSTIDQTKIDISEQHELYERNLADKYGESIESVIERLSPAKRQLAALQLAHQATQAEAERRKVAEREAAENKSRAKRAESQLKDVKKYQRKIADKKARSKKLKRKHQSSKRKVGSKK
ncbi:hypothetical protein EDS67_11335 [candidate division KSB1 bacterium]|nr:MAG: hypothetical protein EDS67_11335 [candidate division KSB1 bacterium]MBC6948901.1 hypothetical protein [candidate division KSB1 bacterium]MCE7942071.1 hypothetical protein [Chlorobi bacterium CHB1]MDL1874409.1 hypothetical protein [Cytophagia bacterium CHB2]